MSYPFVAAKHYSPGAISEVWALVIHFAEGGNTVHYFQNPMRNGAPVDVSSHFVLQYDGSIVQMVRDEDADHCQHTDRGSWSYPGGLTRANGVDVLGSAVMDNADHTRVNRYVHAIELEGFRDKGPNDRQVDALIAWVAERRAKFPTIRGVLGHGDIQNKACPGRLIPWDRLGGHGTPVEGDMQTTVTVQSYPPRNFTTKAGLKTLRRFNATAELAPITALPYSANVDADVTIEQSDNRVPHGPGFLRMAGGGSAGFYILAAEVDLAPVSDPVTAALDHVRGPAQAVLTAIDEATPR